MSRGCILTTVMGRREHLERTLPTWLETGLPVCVVDWGCPQSSGAWAKLQGAVVVTAKADHWHKAPALNLGLERLVTLGFDAALLLDADTLVTDGAELVSAVDAFDARARLSLVSDPGRHRDLTGAMLASTVDLWWVDGFDPRYDGWGYEDLDARLRLWASGVSFAPLPDVFGAIEHDDELRDRYHHLSRYQTGEINRLRFLRRLAQTIAHEPIDPHVFDDPLGWERRLFEAATEDDSLRLALGLRVLSDAELGWEPHRAP